MKLFHKYLLLTLALLTLNRSWLPSVCDPLGSIKRIHEQSLFRSMTDSGTMDIHIDSHEYMNDIRVNLLLSCVIPFGSRYFTNKPRWDVLVSSWVIQMLTSYIGLLVTSFVLLSRWHISASTLPSYLCLARRWWLPSHQEGPENIFPLPEEQIPLLSYLVPYQTSRWTCKASLWSPCYRWRLSNPKAHRIVRSCSILSWSKEQDHTLTLRLITIDLWRLYLKV